MTSETVSSDPVIWHNGAVTYALDAAGNRTQRTSTLAPIPSATYTYNATDHSRQIDWTKFPPAGRTSHALMTTFTRGMAPDPRTCECFSNEDVVCL